MFSLTFFFKILLSLNLQVGGTSGKEVIATWEILHQCNSFIYLIINVHVLTIKILNFKLIFILEKDITNERQFENHTKSYLRYYFRKGKITKNTIHSRIVYYLFNVNKKTQVVKSAT